MKKKYKLYIIGICFLVINLTYAQSGLKIWDKRFGGTVDDYMYSMVATTDGGYLLGGRSASEANGDKSQASQGSADYWVVKIDGSGNKLWDKRFGGTVDDNMYSMIATTDGGYLLGGYSASGANGDKSQTSQGSSDYWVIKIDGSGNKLWDKRFGGTGTENMNSMIATTDGGYLLGGWSASGANGDKSQASQGSADYWVIKISGSGNKLWDKRFGGTSTDYISSMIATTDGGYLLGGYSVSGANGDKSQASQGGEDYWVIKIDGSGNKLWDKRFGGIGNDAMNSMIATTDGGYLLGGRSASGVNGDKSQASQGDNDYWVVKIDGSGNKLWDNRFGGTVDDIMNSMIAATGGYLLGGYSASEANGDKSQPSQGSSDYWVVKISGECTLTASISPSTNQSACAGSTLTFTGSSTGSTSPTYAWSSSPSGFSSALQNPSFTTPTVTQSTNYVLTLTVTEGTCSATATTMVTVNPTPTVNTVSNQTLTVGAATAAINFSGSVPNTTYSWTNSNPNIGLAASGTGNIPSFIVVNSGTTPLVANITVTPSTSSPNCSGTPQTFTITVHTASGTITQMEYFIDSDPGYGSGFAVSFTAGNPVTVNFPVSLSASTDGFHFLTLRAKDAINNWGIVGIRPFYKETISTASLINITAMEYFIDNDLGYGNGTPVTFTANSNVSQSFQIPLNNTLSDGFHLLSFRAKDANNQWSVVGVRPFYKETITSASIVQMEYFIDNDLGYGNGTPITFTANSNVSQSFQIPLNNTLSDGFHFLNFRAKDANNNWSVVGVRPFYKETLPTASLPNIIAMEYFIDNDTGYGNGTPVTGFTAGTTVNQSFTVSLGSLSNGTHQLFFRAKDANNKWSIVGTKLFAVQDNIIVVGNIPTQWCVNTAFNIPFTITGTYTGGNIFTAQLSDINGSFSSPTSIGTLNTTSAGIILATIPNGTSLSNNYKIRIISSTPNVTNTDSKPFQLLSVCPPPCAGLLTLEHPADDILSGNVIKQASSTNGSISATNYVQGNGTKATFQAKSISLNAGFRADSGTIFKAEIGGCNN